MPTWPATLPAKPLVHGYRESFEDRRIVSPVEIGSPRVRPRSAVGYRTFTLPYHLSTSQLENLKAFYRQEARAGEVAFDLPHPRTGETISVKFWGEPQVAAVPTAEQKWRTTVSVLHVLPPTAGLGALVWPPPLYRATVLADNPVAYWRLGETSGTQAVDASGNGWHGVYEGSITLGESGLLTGDSDTAVRFPDTGNTNRVSISGFNVSFPNGISCEAWIKKAAGVQGTYLRRGNDFMLDADGGSNRLRFTINAQFGLGTYLNFPQDGLRHHVAGTFDGSTLRVYLDGQQVSSSQFTGTVNNGSTLLRLGNQDDQPTRVFRGVLDEVALYAHPLSPDRVLAHYEDGIQADGPSLPLAPLIEAYDEQFAALAVRTEFPDGTPRARRRTATWVAPLTVAFNLTADQVKTFERFFEGDTKGGALDWTWTHPREGQVRAAFAGAPELTAYDKFRYRLTVPLEMAA